MEENNNELSEEQTKDESESLEVPKQKRKVYTDQGDPEIDSLYRKWKDGDLDIQPDFQRGFVWDIVKASRLIESILLDIPLPVIYLSQEKDGKEYVIDGQQRLTSFFSFIDGSLPDPRLPTFIKDFKLSGLNVFTEFNGSFFKDIPKELQKKIRYYKIRTITFRKESEKDLKFEIFERLNTGSVSLNDQELRNCIYRGKYNDLLWKLSEDKTFQELLGIKKPEKRMRDVELVLRFASFFHFSHINYKPPMKKFLNSDMEKYRFISNDEAIELKNAFKNTLSIIKSLLGEHSFKRFYSGNESQPNGYWEKKKFNASLYDILMDTFARIDKNKAMQNLDSIREAFLNLMTSDQQFIDSIELSTSSTQAINMRFTKFRNTLESIFSITSKEPRGFSSQLKDVLFKTSPICSICNQKILSLDDAAVDHIEQYWTGGKTIPENARLTHRYCNNARSRKDSKPLVGKVPRNPITSRTRQSRQRTIIIEDDKIFCKSGVAVLINTANWLIKKGKITASKCPVKLQDGGNSYLINTRPYHEDNRLFNGAKELMNNLFLEGNWSTVNCIKWSKELLIHFGISPAKFDLDG
ncbi:DUF262 domain-containing protein [Ignavibacterium sp.]|uniref:GmrSD restriction endonuclease domain-containing protein n=1 Tax=Ignavibacterium sp. TaxID=2651167 RepID=UPI00307EAC53